jgi:hypothetical protein
MDESLIADVFLLEKFPGKGGWTYARVPDILKNKMKHFGWKKVKGTIDHFEISKYHLMPMGDGNLFLPVKKEIRKIIGKEEGDYVKVILYPDDEPFEIPLEFKECLTDSPEAKNFFYSLTESEQFNYIKWIYSAKKEETRIERMAAAINKLENGMKFYVGGKER